MFKPITRWEVFCLLAGMGLGSVITQLILTYGVLHKIL